MGTSYGVLWVRGFSGAAFYYCFGDIFGVFREIPVRLGRPGDLWVFPFFFFFAAELGTYFWHGIGHGRCLYDIPRTRLLVYLSSSLSSEQQKALYHIDPSPVSSGLCGVPGLLVRYDHHLG
jgi:hypothetical protein